MIDFIKQYWFIIELLISFIGILVGFLVYRKTGNKKILSEVYEMIKYRTQNYVDKTPVKGQTFSNLKPVYRLNKVTNELEKTEDVVDIDELVQSCKEQCLNAVLEKFFPTQQTMETAIDSYNNMIDDIDYLADAAELAESYREKFNLSDTLSITDIFKEVQKQADTLKVKIDDFQKLKEVQNEKTQTIEESK